MRPNPTFFPPHLPHTDQQVTAAIRSALGMEPKAENLAAHVGSLLVARGFSDNDHYMRVFARLSSVNTGKLSVEDFASWFDETFPGNGVWKEEQENFEDRLYRNAFAAMVKDLREKKGMTRLGLACVVHISPSQITKFEQGECFPSNETLVKLGQALDYSAARLWALANNVEV
jgi:DNA-binding XRE family transcriptional regulator